MASADSLGRQVAIRQENYETFDVALRIDFERELHVGVLEEELRVRRGEQFSSGEPFACAKRRLSSTLMVTVVVESSS
jgi:hypothetical protein